MRTRERDHLLAVAESMLEGARQLPYLDPHPCAGWATTSVRR